MDPDQINDTDDDDQLKIVVKENKPGPVSFDTKKNQSLEKNKQEFL